MKNYNLVEVILFSRYCCRDPRYKKLVKWLGTTAQSVIGDQHKRAKKIFLKTLKDTPAIYMSWMRLLLSIVKIFQDCQWTVHEELCPDRILGDWPGPDVYIVLKGTFKVRKHCQRQLEKNELFELWRIYKKSVLIIFYSFLQYSNVWWQTGACK